MNDGTGGIYENADILQKTERARKGVEILFELRLINLKKKEHLSNEIDELERRNFVFITKPFRRHGSSERHLYILMRSRIKAFDEQMKKWGNDENK